MMGASVAGTERHLVKSVKKRKLTYFGHLMRKKNKCLHCLEKEIKQGAAPGASPDRKCAWLGNIKLWTVLTIEELLRTVEVRQRWKIVVHDAVNSRTEDD